MFTLYPLFRISLAPHCARLGQILQHLRFVHGTLALQTRGDLWTFLPLPWTPRLRFTGSGAFFFGTGFSLASIAVESREIWLTNESA